MCVCSESSQNFMQNCSKTCVYIIILTHIPTTNKYSKRTICFMSCKLRPYKLAQQQVESFQKTARYINTHIRIHTYMRAITIICDNAYLDALIKQ